MKTNAPIGLVAACGSVALTLHALGGTTFSAWPTQGESATTATVSRDGAWVFGDRAGSGSLVGPLVGAASAYPRINAISGDGAVLVAGSARIDRATHDVFAFPSLFVESEQFTADAYGSFVSADGSVVVGTSWSTPRAYYFGQGRSLGAIWLNQEAPTILTPLAGDNTTSPYALSADGHVVAGLSSATYQYGLGGPWHFTIWVDGQPQPMTSWTNGLDIEAHAINADGSIIAGTSGSRHVRWSRIGGLTDLSGSTTRIRGTPPRTGMDRTFSMSDDGRFLVGAKFDGPSSSARFWSASTGVVDLAQHITRRGGNTAGWTLTRATSISGDGRVIAGIGTFQGQQRGWVVRFDSPGGIAESPPSGGNPPPPPPPPQPAPNRRTHGRFWWLGR